MNNVIPWKSLPLGFTLHIKPTSSHRISPVADDRVTARSESVWSRQSHAHPGPSILISNGLDCGRALLCSRCCSRWGDSVAAHEEKGAAATVWLDSFGNCLPIPFGDGVSAHCGSRRWWGLRVCARDCGFAQISVEERGRVGGEGGGGGGKKGREEVAAACRMMIITSSRKRMQGLPRPFHSRPVQSARTPT